MEKREGKMEGEREVRKENILFCHLSLLVLP